MNLNNLIESINKIEREIRPALEMIEKSRAMIEFAEQSAQKMIIANNLIQQITEGSQKLNSFISSYQEISEDINAIAQDGWYFSFEIIRRIGPSNLKILITDWKKGNKKKHLSFLDNFVTKELKEIENRVIESFPSRKKIIRQIILLHKQKKYIASIPLTCAQIDGITRELFNQGFFSSKKMKGNKKSQKLLDTIKLPHNSFITDVMMNQLAMDNTNNYQVLKDRDSKKGKYDLNRNAIMHGESLEYGTKENSIKAILMMDFIIDFTIIANKKPKSA